MNIRPKKHLLLLLLAVALTLAMAASVQAQVSLRVNIGTAPHWEGVQGTGIQVIREGEGPGYDMFRYGRYYYVYNNNRWYRSRRWNGRFTFIGDRYVPSEFRRVPRNHWHSYPSAWEVRNDRGPGGASAYLQVNFGSTPRWTGIQGTRVEEIPMAQRPGYDVFRYGGSYYAYNNNRWYSSNRQTGNFAAIDDRSVPSDLRSVPRDHWRSYPTAWQNQPQPQNQNQGRTPPGQDKKNRDNRSNGNGR
jgi:hypothetical protein